MGNVCSVRLLLPLDAYGPNKEFPDVMLGSRNILLLEESFPNFFFKPLVKYVLVDCYCSTYCEYVEQEPPSYLSFDPDVHR